MRTISVLLALFVGIGPVHAARPTSLQTSAAQQKPAQQVTVLTVEGMT